MGAGPRGGLLGVRKQLGGLAPGSGPVHLQQLLPGGGETQRVAVLELCPGSMAIPGLCWSPKTPSAATLLLRNPLNRAQAKQS